MQLILAIAALCQVNPAIGDRYLSWDPIDLHKSQTQCHQSYVHCVGIKRASKLSSEEALEKCILEKK